MNKIMKYELRRIIFSKFFIVMSLVLAIFSAYVLNFKIIKGIADTAPFSKWSYAGFLCEIQPFLLLVLMFFLTTLFTKNEHLVKEITLSTPISYSKYFTLKILAIFAACFLMLTIPILLSIIFFAITFQFTNFTTFVIPSLIIGGPSFIFVFGVSLYLGNQKITWLYALIPIIFSISFLKLKILPFFDVFAKGFVWNYPLKLPVTSSGEAVFKLSLAFIISRMILVFLGGLGFIRALKRNV